MTFLWQQRQVSPDSLKKWLKTTPSPSWLVQELRNNPIALSKVFADNNFDPVVFWPLLANFFRNNNMSLEPVLCAAAAPRQTARKTAEHSHPATMGLARNAGLFYDVFCAPTPWNDSLDGCALTFAMEDEDEQLVWKILGKKPALHRCSVFLDQVLWSPALTKFFVESDVPLRPFSVAQIIDGNPNLNERFNCILSSLDIIEQSKRSASIRRVSGNKTHNKIDWAQLASWAFSNISTEEGLKLFLKHRPPLVAFVRQTLRHMNGKDVLVQDLLKFIAKHQDQLSYHDKKMITGPASHNDRDGTFFQMVLQSGMTQNDFESLTKSSIEAGWSWTLWKEQLAKCHINDKQRAMMTGVVHAHADREALEKMVGSNNDRAERPKRKM